MPFQWRKCEVPYHHFGYNTIFCVLVHAVQRWSLLFFRSCPLNILSPPLLRLVGTVNLAPSKLQHISFVLVHVVHVSMLT